MKFQLSEWIEALEKAECPQAVCKGYGRPTGSRCAIGVAFDVMVKKFPLRYGWKLQDDGPLGFRPMDLVKNKSLVAGDIVGEFYGLKGPPVFDVSRQVIVRNDHFRENFKEIATYLIYLKENN